ncbi:MAG TPA: hypothetical protein VJN88_00200 [Ktedonobacterales bacterium]|nr:hypothetical protein [Ktedonobacterales bacterium]
MSSDSRDATPEQRRAVATFLRRLADQAERDETLAATLHTLLAESGLLTSATGDGDAPARGKGRASRSARTATPADVAVDPFPLLRAGGESGLRARLDTLDLAALRQIVRAHRLDPARISARWTARERVVTLIVEQTRARVNHGKAFSRV